MTTSGSYEELFKRELSKFDPICVEVAKNVDAQERLLHQIKVIHSRIDSLCSCCHNLGPVFEFLPRLDEGSESSNLGLVSGWEHTSICNFS
jgi:hypothetical protein